LSGVENSGVAAAVRLQIGVDRATPCMRSPRNTLCAFKKRSTAHFFLMNMAGPPANQIWTSQSSSAVFHLERTRVGRIWVRVKSRCGLLTDDGFMLFSPTKAFLGKF
jgi:hypothetical protein